MRYLNSLKNQWVASRAWMFTSLVFMGFTFYLLGQVASMAHNVPVRLIPYEFDATTGPVEVKQDGTYEDQEYLTTIAMADLQSYTDWTPHTVREQYGRFSNRMTPALWSKTGNAIMADALMLAEGERSQSLYIDEVRIRDTTVQIAGHLQVWQGMERVENMKMLYELTYQPHRGIPKLAVFNAGKPDRTGRKLEK